MSVVLPSDDQIDALEGRQLDDAMWQIEQIRRQLEATAARLTRQCDRTGHFVADGHRSPRAWAMAVTNCSPGEAARRHRTGRLLDLLPDVRAEFRAGRVGVAQVHELARLASNPRCRDQLPGSEQVLLDAAKQLPFEDFKIVCRRWEQLADADGAHRDHEASLQRRNAQLVEVDGEFEWRTRHAAIHGTAMREIFQKFCEAEFRTDWEATVAEHGDKATNDLMPRTAAQRRADALVAIFEAAATAGLDGAPLDIVLNLVMDHEQFEQYARNEIDETPVSIDPAGVRERRCETVDGVPVDPRQAVALAFLGHVRRIVVDGAGVIINAGRLRRLYTRPRPPGPAGARTAMYVARMHDPSGHLPDRSPPQLLRWRNHRCRHRWGDVHAPQHLQVPASLSRPPRRPGPLVHHPPRRFAPPTPRRRLSPVAAAIRKREDGA